ncbi:hypothetical protein BOX37_15860 [Nocardia mangyaensis]|uniref:Uncharacterized protein n=1 Tax=Nocardia mangyaensis TaxID=2213200 RepID=A0A1J0VT40_9NOCA|nr:hypothetical protein [Nocardia mangyaensis]APE35178.1 hypothetical protein BOX37_15860 [Nocardia mangyaensis]
MSAVFRGSGGEPASESVGRLLDEIDELVEESMRGGEPRTGYNFGDPSYPPCPNPHCTEPWHGLAVTARMAFMRDYSGLDPDYDYDTDDSPVLCAGSARAGGWQPAPEDVIEAWRAAQLATFSEWTEPEVPAPETPVARAEKLWTALARPAVLIVVVSWLIALVSMLLPPAQWRWLTIGVGIMAPMWFGWLYARAETILPAGYARRRLRARPTALAAAALMIVVGWIPAHWGRSAPADAGDVRAGYFALLVACAVACLGHAVVQVGRVRLRASAEQEEFDAAEHGESLYLRGFGWMLFVLPITLLFGWIVGYFAFQPAAMWAAVALVTVIVATFFLEAAVVKIVTKAHDSVDIPMIVFFTIGIGALLVWSVLRLAAAPLRL